MPELEELLSLIGKGSAFEPSCSLAAAFVASMILMGILSDLRLVFLMSDWLDDLTT